MVIIMIIMICTYFHLEVHDILHVLFYLYNDPLFCTRNISVTNPMDLANFKFSVPSSIPKEIEYIL